MAVQSLFICVTLSNRLTATVGYQTFNACWTSPGAILWANGVIGVALSRWDKEMGTSGPSSIEIKIRASSAGEVNQAELSDRSHITLHCAIIVEFKSAGWNQGWNWMCTFRQTRLEVSTQPLPLQPRAFLYGHYWPRGNARSCQSARVSRRDHK